MDAGAPAQVWRRSRDTIRAVWGFPGAVWGFPSLGVAFDFLCGKCWLYDTIKKETKE